MQKKQEKIKVMEKNFRILSQTSKITCKDSLSPLSSSFNACFFYKEYPSSSPIDANYMKTNIEKKVKISP